MQLLPPTEVKCTFIIPAPLLCSFFYSVRFAPECTFTPHKQLQWGLLCPPQCGWADTLSVTGHRNRAAPLPYSQASVWPQKHWEEKEKRKTRNMIDALL